ncbi:MAG TPA: hypothetical protein VHA13_00010 [Gammaproteobacteria bacterium]|nr:hypothetical protein [Gammaproteobacteria bacterium]
MDRRKHVLLVTNAVSDQEVIQIKESLFTPQLVPMSIKLSLVHVVPTLPTCYFNIPSMITLADRYYQEARDNLERVGDALNISKRDQWLIMGNVHTEVLRLACKLNIQFILANSANLIELRKSSMPSNQDSQRFIIDNVSELCAGL